MPMVIPDDPLYLPEAASWANIAGSHLIQQPRCPPEVDERYGHKPIHGVNTVPGAGCEPFHVPHVEHCMYYSKYIMLPVLFMLAIGTVSAQGKGKVMVLMQRDGPTGPVDTVKLVRSALMLNPILFLRGEVPLYYERVLSPRVSLELAVGLTTRNSMDLPGSHERADEYSAGTKVHTRASYHAGLRYYLTKDMEPQGFYFQGEFAYLEHAKDISMKDEQGRSTDVALRDESVFKDGRLYFGYQRLASTNNFLLDTYFGAGLRSSAVSSVHERLDLEENKWSYTQEEIHDQVAAFFFGVKLGYGF